MNKQPKFKVGDWVVVSNWPSSLKERTFVVRSVSEDEYGYVYKFLNNEGEVEEKFLELQHFLGA